MSAPQPVYETSAVRTSEARPPLGSWGRLYALVLAALALDIALLLWLTGRFR